MGDELAFQQKHPLGAIAYLFFFVSGLVLLYLEPYNQDEFVRFHARQSIGFSIAWFAVNVVLGVFISVTPGALSWMLRMTEDLVNFALAVFWLYLMYKAYTGDRYRIPELADIIDQVAGPKP
ncbi:MAG TPA: DUF4870 domain-containing protein [Candidatus Binataceae bacterium]|nr:DUF4870 domain-containing protein [Candidatus Binataceae bacterium]